MAGFLTICIAVLMFRDSLMVQTLDSQSEKYTDNSFQLRNKVFTRGDPEVARLNGDLILGAMLPIHLSRVGFCSGLYVDGIVLVEAFIFALREVNSRKLIPDEITLGYEIRDTCNSVIVAQRHTLDIILEEEYGRIKGNTKDNNGSILTYSTRDYKQSTNSLIAVVGAGNSEISIAVNRVLSAFNIPQIGFASTSRYLSEKLRFPSFFRTVPSDTHQVHGLVALFQRFSWNYVALLVSDGDYGRPLADSFRSSAKTEGICITHERLVPFHMDLEAAKFIVRELNSKTNVEIIVILLPEPDVETLLRAMLEIGLTNKTLIASDSWSKAIKDLKFSNIVAGTLGFAHHYTQVKEFEEYFLALKPNTNTWNPWFNKTWEHLFDCVLAPNETFTSGKIKKICDLEKQRLKKEHFTRLHYVSNIINAVFAVANGVQNFYRKEHKPFSLTSHELLKSLKELTFQTYDGDNITFDRNGDVIGKYSLVNIRPDLVTRNVGIWNGEYLELGERIWWNTAQRNAPKGVCSPPCLAGWHKHTSNVDPKCCWTCQRCPAGMISNRSGVTKCSLCPKDHMTNLNQTACVFIPLKYLDWRSFWTVSIVILAFISVTILFFVVLLFIRFVNTPVVKSSNRELSFLLCMGLFLTFLVPFVFAGKPTNFKCILSQVMFCVGCALTLSAMLFRTLRIVLLFEFNIRRRWLLNNKYQIAMTLALTFAELTYCLLWVAVKPPGVRIAKITPRKRYLVCEFDKYWYGGSHLLLIFLSVVCTILAVKGRKLPKNFNEVRHIGLSMFTFNIVWVVFMCAQYGASLEYDVKINCFAMIISSLMILVLLFGPKIFVLLFRAHLNKKEEFEAEVRRYSFGVPNGNCSASATSLRRGSSVTFRTPPIFNDQFLNVASDNSKRMRSHSFDAMASKLYQNTNRSPKHFSKETQTNFLSDFVNVTDLRNDIPPIVVKITEEENDSFATDDKNVNVQEYDTESLRMAFDDANYRDTDRDAMELKKIQDLDFDDSNFDCSKELENLLADLDIPNENIANGNIKSLEKQLNNGQLTLSSNTENEFNGGCTECTVQSGGSYGNKTSDVTYSFEGAAKPQQTQNLLENDLESGSAILEVSDHKNWYDRETVL
jgi:calcium-sensing receptor